MKRLTSFDIKLIAFILMIIDHTGRLFFPNYSFMVAIGRLSFPLFAWLVAIGQRHTSDVRKYLVRLVILGIISQPIYAYFYQLIFSGMPSLNILFTLAWGVSLLAALKKADNAITELMILIPFMAIAELAYLEYGSYGVATVYLMSKLESKRVVWPILLVLTNFIYVLAFNYPAHSILSIFSLLIIIQHNGKRGGKARWFYPLYPLHFGILTGIHWLLNWQFSYAFKLFKDMSSL